jgi:hypothetical protein
MIKFLPYYNFTEDDILKSSVLDDFTKYFNSNVTITPDGRTAISVLLKSLGLRSNDEVFITTTFETQYVSSCVTSAIFNICKPSREFNDKTKVIFVIHEFGIPHPNIESLYYLAKYKNIILIEDCAHTITLRPNSDYQIYSLSKIYPISCGGLIVGNNELLYNFNNYQKKIINYVDLVMSKYFKYTIKYSDRKRINFKILKDMFKCINIYPIFDIDSNIVPSYHFPIKVKNPYEVVEEIKRHKIECGVWHGSNIIVLPIGPFLNKNHLNKIFEITKQAIK